MLSFTLFILFSPSNAQPRLSKSEIRKATIDSVFDQAEKSGLNTSQRLKYIFRFSARKRIPLVELGKDLEKDSIEVISIYQEGKRWWLSAFKNEIHSRATMFEHQTALRWKAFKYKVEDFAGFTIAEADIDLSNIPDDEFYPFILSLDNQDLFNVAIRVDKLKEHPKALITFHELINRNFKADTSYFKMGSALVATHEYVDGIEHWEKAVKLNPEYLEAYIHLGIIFFENSHWKKANANFKEADRIKPNDDVILYHLSKSLMKLERYNEAFTTIKRAIKLNPKNVYAKGVLKSLKTPAIKKLRKQFPGK